MRQNIGLVACFARTAQIGQHQKAKSFYFYDPDVLSETQQKVSKHGRQERRHGQKLHCSFTVNCAAFVVNAAVLCL